MKKYFAFCMALLCGSPLLAGVQFAAHPYLQSLTPHSVNIMWVSSTPDVTGWVEYGVDSCSEQAFQCVNGLKQAYTSTYRVSLQNLKPGTTYQYRVVLKEIADVWYGGTSMAWGDSIVSPVYTFTTPLEQPSSVNCVIFNDIHSQPHLYGELMSNNHISWSTPDFVVFNGDVLNEVDSEANVAKLMLDPASNYFASSKPFVYVRGNHEFRHRHARHILDYVDAGDHKGYYAFRWGPAYFIVLCSGEDKTDGHKEYYGLLDGDAMRREQAQWLQAQLQSDDYKNAPYHVILAHIGFWSNKGSYTCHGGKDTRALFLDMLNEAKPDVMICGHTHYSSVMEANEEHHFPIVVGGGKNPNSEEPKSWPTVMQLQIDKKNGLNLVVHNYKGETCGKLKIKH